MEAKLFALFALVVIFVHFHAISAQLDKSKAVGPCIDGLCPPRHFCAPDNECYPKQPKQLHSRKLQRDAPAEAGTGAVSIGACVNGLCPNGFECINNTCFRTKSVPAPSGPIGPCVNAKCPDGYSCNQAEYKCYAN